MCLIKNFINKIFIVLSLFVFSTTLYSNELYILPKEKNEALEKIESLIKNSKEEIQIAVYNFSHKKISKQLIKAHKNGINVKVYFDSEKIKKDDELYKTLEKNGIKTIIIKDKLHTKLAIFDRKTVYFGSANWTKKSFKENYEILYFTDDKKIVKTLYKFLSDLN